MSINAMLGAKNAKNHRFVPSDPRAGSGRHHIHHRASLLERLIFPISLVKRNSLK
jgi:hypothetical protein